MFSLLSASYIYASCKQLVDMHINSVLINRVEKSWMIVINANVKKECKNSCCFFPHLLINKYIMKGTFGVGVTSKTKGDTGL